MLVRALFLLVICNEPVCAVALSLASRMKVAKELGAGAWPSPKTGLTKFTFVPIPERCFAELAQLCCVISGSLPVVATKSTATLDT